MAESVDCPPVGPGRGHVVLAAGQAEAEQAGVVVDGNDLVQLHPPGCKVLRLQALWWERWASQESPRKSSSIAAMGLTGVVHK